MTNESTTVVYIPTFLNHKAAMHSSGGLAEDTYTDLARIRKVMTKLRKADLVKTKEGMGGGYLFHRGSREIDLTMMAGAPETPFVIVSWKSRNSHIGYPVSSNMVEVMGGFCDGLDQCCRERLTYVTIADLGKKISGKAAAN